jgi:signal peptidase II
MPNSSARRSLCFAISLAVFFLDRVTKLTVEKRLSLHDGINVVPGLFRIVHVQNQGAAFGIFNDSPSAWKTGLLIAFSVAALLMVSWLLWKGGASRMSTFGLTLILGGAAGNLWDRLGRGYVTDFLLFYHQQYQWPAFNVADSAIVVGAMLLAADILFRPATTAA